jgi:drug/metabolite transporter (DMT)-like permease
MTFKQWASFIALAIIWGASFLWIKLAVQNNGPFTIASLRLVAALLVLVPFVIVQKPGIPRTRRMWGILMIQGLISSALPWILITWAEKYIDSALATVMNATVPLSFFATVAYLLRC